MSLHSAGTKCHALDAPVQPAEVEEAMSSITSNEALLEECDQDSELQTDIKVSNISACIRSESGVTNDICKCEARLKSRDTFKKQSAIT